MIQLKSYKSGRFEKDPTGYSYFVPTPINDQWTWENPSLDLLLEKASLRIGELNAYSLLVPNIDMFIRLHVVKEAVISNRIEGTQTKIEEALLDEEAISPERRNDWNEVNNYIRALNEAIHALEKLPLSSRLIKQTHKTLLSNVRGEHKLPGEFRKSQNWIGGNTLHDAVFIPPHHTLVPELMADMEKFLHNDTIDVPDLIKIAIAHYQFETIHPFLDGNGRIGRLLITLFLFEKKILQKPLLYLSSYFEKNKGLYYDNLTFVRTHNDMTQWLKYFLAGVAETAETASKTLIKIIKLKAHIESNLLVSFGKRAANAAILLNTLFQQPIISVADAQKILNITYKAANDLVAEMVQNNILIETTGQNRNRLFIFDEYINLFKP